MTIGMFATKQELGILYFHGAYERLLLNLTFRIQGLDPAEVPNSGWNLEKSQTEMQWQDWEAIAAHSSDGHLMLTPCLPDVFLFVQASEVLTGLLEVEIKRIIKKIQSIHQNNEMFVPFSPLWDNLEDEMSEVLADSDEQILYRGRRMSF